VAGGRDRASHKSTHQDILMRFLCGGWDPCWGACGGGERGGKGKG
jgi:hypothetical protein